MKKISLLTWLAILCLVLTNSAASGQTSRTPAKELLEQMLNRQKTAQQTGVEGRPPVSRKRTPKTVPSRNNEPAQPDDKDSGRSSKEGGRQTDSTSSEERADEPSPRRETSKRRTSDRYPQRERTPSQRERTDEEKHKESPPAEEQRNGKRSVPTPYPRHEKTDEKPNRKDRYDQPGKAKCGVPGCQHPGKHKGLHKRNGNRPVRSGW